MKYQDLYFEDFIGNVLLAWSQASRGNKENSIKFLKKIPKPYRHLTKTQYSFLECYFNNEDANKFFHEIIQDKDYNYQ